MTRLFMPVADDGRQIWSAITTAYRECATDLGDYYDATIREFEPRWVERLQAERHRSISIHDPYFVFDEPLRNDDSVIHSCLAGRDHRFWNAFRTARTERNRWFHNERESNLGNALAALDPLLLVASALSLDVHEELLALHSRVVALRRGELVDEEVDEGKLRELARRLREEKLAREAQELEVQRAYQEAASARSDRDSVAREKKSLEQRLADYEKRYEVAMAGWGEATALLENAAEQVRIEKEAEIARLLAAIPEEFAPVVLPEGLEPGDPWPPELDLGSFDAVFMAVHRDLWDKARGRYLSDNVDAEGWAEFTARCTEVLGNRDCDVVVDRSGHTAATNFPEWGMTTFLGTLDPDWLRVRSN